MVSILLGAIVVTHYVFGLKDYEVMLQTAHEYVSFLLLIGSLFVVAGGMHIRVKGEATPLANCVFLFIGAVLSNFIGTTGASMILIRPWIRMNKYRITAFHIVFFIFLVSNVGGALTPIGDPPLFLGYLRGVPFFWVLENVWVIWLLAVSLVLLIFYFLDRQNFAKAPAKIRQKETGAGEEWHFDGMQNIFFLVMIIGSVFINHPTFLREGIMLLAAILSYKTTKKEVHESNEFNFGPIKEVGILFLGIFATMVPALQWLEHNSAAIGLKNAAQFYWGSGALSSFLDNAPTYLNFLSAAIGLFATPGLAAQDAAKELATHHAQYIRAISIGSVFFGAMTYIGNGPNFLVKSIADQSKIETPTFFGYIFKYSLPFLLPVLALVWWLFFKTNG